MKIALMGFFFTLISLSPGKTRAIDKNAIGISLGISNFNEEDFSSYELFGLYGLPWYWNLGINKQWMIQTSLGCSLGGLTQSDDTEFLATFGPAISFSLMPARLTFDAGVGIALLSDERIGNHDFGGTTQFTAHGGVSYRLFKNISLGYRLSHISDGGIHDGHGLNRHLLALSCRF